MATKIKTSEFDRGFRHGLAAGAQEREIMLGIIEQHQFSLACTECDAEGPDSRKAARDAGWREIIFDDSMSWNFLGLCPDCSKQEKAKRGK